LDYQLIVPYIPNLRRYARALIGDREGADDLVQDTLERAVRKFHLWKPGDLRAWLFSIMHNVFVNQLKARKIAYEIEVDESIAAPMSSVTSTDLMDLDRALAAISPDQREVVLLIALEDMTYAEIARALGIPIGTVMSRLSRARMQIKDYLDGKRPALRRVK
jgi:RNA polymerase sigma-70 factor (ECF subfamily)